MVTQAPDSPTPLSLSVGYQRKLLLPNPAREHLMELDPHDDRRSLLPSNYKLRKRSKESASMARRIGNILAAKKSKAKSNSSNASVSAVGDACTNCSVGEKSVAMTVNSQTTVKVSNRKPEKPHTKRLVNLTRGKSGWMSLKRLVGVAPDTALTRSHSKSLDFDAEGKSKSTGNIWSAASPLRKRILSEDGAKQSARLSSELDSSIKGRLDGVDILSLGTSMKSSLKPKPSAEKPKEGPMDSTFDPLRYSFVGASRMKRPAELVSDMIWASGGKNYPELVLEGYLPGHGDRWTVNLGNDNLQEEPDRQHPATISEEEDDTAAALAEDGSTNLPSHMLWDNIWGNGAPPPAPTHMKSGKSSSDDENEDVMQLTAACSVPVDLDDDVFIIDTPQHFRSVHDVVMVPLQGRRFSAALKVLAKLLKGLEELPNGKFEHLQACTHHNMGIILMCQAKFKDALARFKNAVRIRAKCLPQNHPDFGVSLMRQGEAQLALRNFKAALKSFEMALSVSPAEDATRAKMLNNIGVAYYQLEDFPEALKALTSALEIQRQWLDGPVRREPIVYDASITLGNMGKVFLELEEYEVAYSVFEEACLLQTSTFRKDHNLVLTSLENLALTHIESDEYDQAIPILRGLLRAKESRFGLDHKSTIETMGMLSFLLIKEIELEEGLDMLKKVASWQEDNMAASHPSVKFTKKALTTVANMMNGEELWV